MNIENQHDDVIDNATRWIVLLRSGQASEADWQAYRQWRLLAICVIARSRHPCTKSSALLG